MPRSTWSATSRSPRHRARFGCSLGAANKAERLLIPFQNRRWDGDFRTLAALVSSGRLGRIHTFENRWSKYQPEPRTRVAWKAESRFNGPLYDLFPHLIDQAIVLFGRPRGVFARIEQNRPAATLPDRVRLLLDYDSGLEALLEVDQLDAFSGRQLAPARLARMFREGRIRSAGGSPRGRRAPDRRRLGS